MVVLVEGDIFKTRCQVIVNPVNTRGVMNGELAEVIKKKYPGCVFGYIHACDNGALEPGKLLLWKGVDKWILHFPTKIDWWQPSRIPYIEHGLQKFVKTYRDKGITSIAFPLVECEKDEDVKGLMKRYLEPLDIRCEVYIPKKQQGL